MTTTNIRRSFVHFHSRYLFGLASKECEDGRGVPCAILSAAAIEALPGDIALSLHARQEFERAIRDESNQKRDIWGRRQPEFVVSTIGRLTPMEESFAETIKKLTAQKRSGLDQYYVLEGLLRGEARDPTDSKDKKTAWRVTLLKGVNELFDLRNAIVHRGGSELLYDNGGSLVNESAALPPPLMALKEVLDIDAAESQRSGWLGLVDTPALASWSLGVAKSFINSTLHTLPDTRGFRDLKLDAKL